jgi:hypothetical protein
MNGLLKFSIPIALGLIAIGGCKEEDNPTTSNTPPSEPAPTIQFSATNISQTSWSFVSASARYDSALGETTVETFDDSALTGKFSLRFKGDRPDTLIYDLTPASGGARNEVYSRFVPGYYGSTPTGVFELTGVASDSLYAEVIVTRFGVVGDTVAGTFTSRLKLAGVSPKFTILLVDGTFKVKRTQ